MHQNIRGEEAEEPSHYASVHFWSPPDHNLSQALRAVNKNNLEKAGKNSAGLDLLGPFLLMARQAFRFGRMGFCG